ncbi:hypothetical protein IWX85_003160 [Polaromonas sp. CG_9.11]|nr:hypothetical protein [Polaromonas sp. CG_9.11]
MFFLEMALCTCHCGVQRPIYYKSVGLNMKFTKCQYFVYRSLYFK